MKFFLDFESEIAELEAKINELRHLGNTKGTNILEEISSLEFKANKLIKNKYSSLSPWQRVQVARHPERPHFSDYISDIFENFIELKGDRNYAQDDAIIGGLASIGDMSVMIIGHEKGYDTNTRLKRNFGMARPEGYRKSSRLMKFASNFGLPIITFIDTAGAYPGIGAEQRGQSEAIATSIKTCLNVKVPILSIIIGEGGSGGAVAIATADRVLMLENSVYSVISPEGCASILWKKDGYDEVAANSLKLTAEDLIKLNVIDSIIKEPLGGAHRDPNETIKRVKENILVHLKELDKNNNNNLLANRRKKYLQFGSDFKV